MEEEKTAVFRLYDFEGSASWKEYLRRVDISGPGHNEKLLKLKAKWYKREVDPEFDLEWLTKYGSAPLNNPQKEKPPERSGPSTRPTSAGSSTAPTPAAAPPLAMTLMHFAILMLGVVSVLPMSPRAVHRSFLQLVVLASIFKVVHRFGRPKIFPLEQLKLWAVRAMNTTDSHYGFMALVFIPAVPTRLIFIPATVLAAYHVAFYLRSRFAAYAIWKRYGEKIFQYMAARQNQALLLNAVAEIGTGFVLILQLFTRLRNLLTLVMFWQWLRMRYWSADSAPIHRQAWANLGQKAAPLLERVPIVKTPLRYAQRWFANQPV